MNDQPIFMKKLLSLTVLVLLSACSMTVDEKVLSDWIVLEQPTEDQLGTCPLIVSGEARGPWYFEAVFPVILLDAEGQLIAQGIATAQEEWMTEDFVPFSMQLYYETLSTEGTLILEKSNPSGLPENALQLSVPVKLQSCDGATMEEYKHTLVEAYIRNNISSISPVEAVLGGTWYVLSVEFPDVDRVSVIYEDGHIQEEFQASYSVSESGDIELKL